jgi:hypothetical protein
LFTAKLVTTVLVAVHLVVAIWHGNAHTALAVGLPPAKNAFVIAVIVIAPVIAVALLWTRFAVAGLSLVALSMLGALLFGVYHHFVLISPDNVHHLPPGSLTDRSTFAATAAALAWLELAAVLYGAWCLKSVARRAPV